MGVIKMPERYANKTFRIAGAPSPEKSLYEIPSPDSPEIKKTNTIAPRR